MKENEPQHLISCQNYADSVNKSVQWIRRVHQELLEGKKHKNDTGFDAILVDGVRFCLPNKKK